MSKTLYHLVHSLQKAEKRSLSLLAKEGDKGFMKLYEVLEKMEEYDEKKFKAQFSSLSSSALSKAKKTLQQNILRVLHHSHYHNHEEIQLLDAITKAQILKLKGQNELAMETITALKPELQLMERNALLIYVQQMEIEITRLRYLKDTTVKEFDTKYDALFDTLRKTENLAQYRRSTHNAQLLRTHFGAGNRVGQYEQYMKMLAKEARFKNIAAAKSGLAADQYFIFWFWYYEMQKDVARQTDIIKQWKANVEKRKAFLKKFPAHYYYILYQLGVLAAQQSNKTLFAEAVKGLSTSINKIEEVEYERLVYLFSVQAIAYQQRGDYIGVIVLQPVFEKIKNEYGQFLNAERDIYMQKQLAIGYLLKRDYSAALTYVNDVLNQYPKLVFGMLCQFRVISMLCHIGLQNYLVLENLYRSFQYFVKGKTGLSATEKLIVKFVQQVEKNNTTAGIQKVIAKFLPEFKKEAEGDYFFVALLLEKI